jgi:hypothetical protein
MVTLSIRPPRLLAPGCTSDLCANEFHDWLNAFGKEPKRGFDAATCMLRHFLTIAFSMERLNGGSIGLLKIRTLRIQVGKQKMVAITIVGIVVSA